MEQAAAAARSAAIRSRSRLPQGGQEGGGGQQISRAANTQEATAAPHTASQAYALTRPPSRLVVLGLRECARERPAPASEPATA